jgi:hypothetical protein
MSDIDVVFDEYIRDTLPSPNFPVEMDYLTALERLHRLAYEAVRSTNPEAFDRMSKIKRELVLVGISEGIYATYEALKVAGTFDRAEK